MHFEGFWRGIGIIMMIISFLMIFFWLGGKGGGRRQTRLSAEDGAMLCFLSHFHCFERIRTYSANEHGRRTSVNGEKT